MILLALILIPMMPANADPMKPFTVRIDTSNTVEPISTLIYGQFIEHLGRCIYGGIWAEMLEDRKFYFPVTEKYAPYVSLTDTDFPVWAPLPGRSSGILPW